MTARGTLAAVTTTLLTASWLLTSAGTTRDTLHRTSQRGARPAQFDMLAIHGLGRSMRSRASPGPWGDDAASGSSVAEAIVTSATARRPKESSSVVLGELLHRRRMQPRRVRCSIFFLGGQS